MSTNEEYSLCDEVEQSILAQSNRQKLEENLVSVQNIWGHSLIGVEAKKAAMTMLSTKTGMYARIPLMCKGLACPYEHTCQLLKYDLAPIGEYCPMETAQIELRHLEYSKDFELDKSSFTDRTLVSEIINIDVMLERCKALIAKEGTPTVEVVAGVTENGAEILRPEVSKNQEAYERYLKKKEDLLGKMLGTRKDNKNDDNKTDSLTDLFSNLKKDLVVEQRPKEFIDVEVEETE